MRNGHGVFRGFRFHVRDAEEIQRSAAFLRVPQAFDRSDLCRLIFACVEAVLITDNRLNRREHQQQPERHRKHLLDRRVAAAFQQVIGTRSCHQQPRDDKRRNRHMRQPVRKRRVEDDMEPADRHDMIAFDTKTLRRLHPAIRRKNPEGRDQCADGDHQRSAEVRLRSNLVPAEQHDAEEAGFQEKRGHHLIGEQRAGDRAGETREAAPVGAELVAHYDAGYHAHAEGHREHLRPEQT